MPLKSIVGVDHVVVAARNLDAAAQTWESLGFTLSPRGIHSPTLGTANHTIMFAEDYIELMGVLTPTDHNQGTRAFLDRGEGLERTAFTTRDAAAGIAELTGLGIQASAPVHFGRPVDLPGGGQAEARFSAFRWPAELAPAGMRIFACQHHTPEVVFLPEISTHRNGAVRIARIEIVSADPAATAAQMAALIDQPVRQAGDARIVPSGVGRADFVFLSPAAFAGRYSASVRQGSTDQGAVVLTLVTRDMAGARSVLGRRALPTREGIAVAAGEATGVVLQLVEG